MDLINDLIYFYVSNCKLLKDKGDSLANFNKKIQDTIQNEFEAQIQASTAFLKSEISNLTFVQPDCHIKLKNYLKKLFDSQGLIGEKNFKLMAYKIISSLYDLLCKQLQVINISEGNISTINDAIDDLFLSLPIMCSSFFVPKFNHFKSLTDALVLNQADFDELISKNKNDFTDSEVKYLKKIIIRSKRASKNENNIK